MNQQFKMNNFVCELHFKPADLIKCLKIPGLAHKMETIRVQLAPGAVPLLKSRTALGDLQSQVVKICVVWFQFFLLTWPLNISFYTERIKCNWTKASEKFTNRCLQFTSETFSVVRSTDYCTKKKRQSQNILQYGYFFILFGKDFQINGSGSKIVDEAEIETLTKHELNRTVVLKDFNVVDNEDDEGLITIEQEVGGI